MQRNLLLLRLQRPSRKLNLSVICTDPSFRKVQQGIIYTDQTEVHIQSEENKCIKKVPEQ